MGDTPQNTITLPLEVHQQLLASVHEAQLATEALRQELTAERAKTPDQRLADAAALIEVFKTITDHAVANLSPEFIRDLPREAFDVAAKLVAKVMGATQRDGERAGVWSERAELIQQWRDKRKARGWGEAPGDPGPPVAKPPKKRWWWLGL